MNNTTLKVIAIFVLGLVVGLAAGSWGTRYCFTHRGHKDPGARILAKLDKELKLTSDQHTKVAAILEAQKKKMDAMRGQFKPKFEAVKNEGEAEIRKVLTAEQAEKFTELKAKWEKFHGRGRWGRMSRSDGGEPTPAPGVPKPKK